MGITYKDKRYFIYTLADPDTGEIRYIGISIHPKTRLREHMQEGNHGQSKKARWISWLQGAGKEPRLSIIDSCIGWDAAREKEKFYCTVFDNGNLLNSKSHVKGGNPKRVVINRDMCLSTTYRGEQCRREPIKRGRCWQHERDGDN